MKPGGVEERSRALYQRPSCTAANFGNAAGKNGCGACAAIDPVPGCPRAAGFAHHPLALV
ncbi:hypothetical protein D8B25_01125 [Verminephrobacter aporrectodeae subsp. tuberculatae]|nr:hypothetical protein [Verminephrobacter aporrectodeae subsp. tuberculatae]MCW8169256.1 hypothetical protein [Verminephrobacter aporrectodeae subsp. tuberculatae]MCW8174010.1 hypothetical protein [Verminephrobacter aporrectodeae subsp. tuberculatae]MCW8201705.1 hypothetical protein [Verminephrobacter aporrectodeae subsp. tuberculatae]